MHTLQPSSIKDEPTLAANGPHNPSDARHNTIQSTGSADAQIAPSPAVKVELTGSINGLLPPSTVKREMGTQAALTHIVPTALDEAVSANEPDSPTIIKSSPKSKPSPNLYFDDDDDAPPLFDDSDDEYQNTINTDSSTSPRLADASIGKPLTNAERKTAFDKELTS